MSKIHQLTLSAMFLALGLVLPFLTGQIPEIGSLLLPMHLPVFLCGLICSWRHGLALGALLPILRSLLFGMPPLYPKAIAMTFELAVYGFVAGFLYARAKKKSLFALYGSILAAMLAGRAAWGLAQTVLLGLKDTPFSFSLFLSGAFLEAIPGILLQLILLPAVMLIVGKTKWKS